MGVPGSRNLDPWNDAAITAAGDASVRELGRLLELRGLGEDQVAIRAAYLELLGIAPGERVLDVGCGTGVVTREVARRVGPAGLSVGLDPSPVLLSVGRVLAEREGVAGQTEWHRGDVRALPFGEGTFDAVLAITVLSHVAGGERAIPELVRVVRPGGRVGVFDLDPDSWIISHPDRDLTRRIGAAASDAVSSVWIARRLPGLLRAAGLRDIRVRAFTPVERDPDGFYAWIAEVKADQAVQSGAISEGDRQAWLTALRTEQASGNFIAGISHLFVWGSRRV